MFFIWIIFCHLLCFLTLSFIFLILSFFFLTLFFISWSSLLLLIFYYLFVAFYYFILCWTLILAPYLLRKVLLILICRSTLFENFILTMAYDRYRLFRCMSFKFLLTLLIFNLLLYFILSLIIESIMNVNSCPSIG